MTVAAHSGTTASDPAHPDQLSDAERDTYRSVTETTLPPSPACPWASAGCLPDTEFFLGSTIPAQ